MKQYNLFEEIPKEVLNNFYDLCYEIDFHLRNNSIAKKLINDKDFNDLLIKKNSVLNTYTTLNSLFKEKTMPTEIIHTSRDGHIVQSFSGICEVSNKERKGHEYAVQFGDNIHYVNFQNGAITANGVNGLTNELLLIILIHRTKYLNDLFPCQENEKAIEHMEQALAQFNKRTSDRIKRSVEGTENI